VVLRGGQRGTFKKNLSRRKGGLLPRIADPDTGGGGNEQDETDMHEKDKGVVNAKKGNSRTKKPIPRRIVPGGCNQS